MQHSVGLRPQDPTTNGILLCRDMQYITFPLWLHYLQCLVFSLQTITSDGRHAKPVYLVQQAVQIRGDGVVRGMEGLEFGNGLFNSLYVVTDNLQVEYLANNGALKGGLLMPSYDQSYRMKRDREREFTWMAFHLCWRFSSFSFNSSLSSAPLSTNSEHFPHTASYTP